MTFTRFCAALLRKSSSREATATGTGADRHERLEWASARPSEVMPKIERKEEWRTNRATPVRTDRTSVDSSLCRIGQLLWRYRKVAAAARSADRAPGSLCAEAGTRAAAPFPAPLSPLAASFLRCAPDRFLLTKPNTSCTIEMPASLRSDGVRDHPGMPFGFLPE